MLVIILLIANYLITFNLVLIIGKRKKDNLNKLVIKLQEIENKLSIIDLFIQKRKQEEKQGLNNFPKENQKEIDNYLEEIKETIEHKFYTLQNENSQALVEMQKTINEKLEKNIKKQSNEFLRFMGEHLDSLKKTKLILDESKKTHRIITNKPKSSQQQMITLLD